MIEDRREGTAYSDCDVIDIPGGSEHLHSGRRSSLRLCTLGQSGPTSYMRGACDEWHGDSAGVKGLSPSALSRVLGFIEAHLDERITLDALSMVAYSSRFHFLRKFKVSMGVTPMVFVEKCRIWRAQDLIRAGDLTMAAIAVAVGFSEHSHFCRRFRLHVGMTPTAYAQHGRPRMLRDRVI